MLRSKNLMLNTEYKIGGDYKVNLFGICKSLEKLKTDGSNTVISQIQKIIEIDDMKKLIEMPYGNSTVIVAVDDVPQEIVREEIRKLEREAHFEDFTTPQKVEEDFGIVSDMIYRCSKPIIDSFEKLGKEKVPPKKATADFALSFSGKGKIYVVEASTEGSIKVSLEWDLEKLSPPTEA